MLSNTTRIPIIGLVRKSPMAMKHNVLSAMAVRNQSSNNNKSGNSKDNANTPATTEGSKTSNESSVQTRQDRRGDPLNVFYDMEKEFDRLWNTSFFKPMWPSFYGNRFNFDWPAPDTVTTQKAKTVAIDFKETPDRFEIHAELPGAKKEDIKIHLDEKQNLLTINGETKFERDEKNDKYHTVERRYGSFSRSIRIPENAKLEDISANYENGVLLVKIPKEVKDENMKKPKEIKIE